MGGETGLDSSILYRCVCSSSILYIVQTHYLFFLFMYIGVGWDLGSIKQIMRACFLQAGE